MIRYHVTMVTGDETMGLVLIVPLVVAFRVKQLHHNIPMQVIYLYWSFQLGLQLYDPSILSHFFLNHRSEKPKQVSCQNPPQLIHKQSTTVIYIKLNLPWISTSISKTKQKMHTKWTSSCKSQAFYFCSCNFCFRTSCFYSNTNCKPYICWGLLFRTRGWINIIMAMKVKITTHFELSRN